MNEISDAKEFSDVEGLTGENRPGTVDAPKADLAAQKVPLPLQKVCSYKKTRACLVAVVALQILIVCGTAVPAAMTLKSGKVVTLQTKPVDPYDMFRGDYVHLRYDINDVKVYPWPAADTDVYVALHKNGQYWQPRFASITRPKLWPGEVCIRGKYQYGASDVHYGIEQVFVPEKTGHAAERAKSLTVDVAVDADGNSTIKRVLNSDRTVYDANAVIFGHH